MNIPQVTCHNKSAHAKTEPYSYRGR